MKIRESLVSNSSSTSFIIAFKDSKPCPHCHRKDPNIVKIIDNYKNSYKDEVDAVGLENVKKHVECNFYPEDGETTEIIKNIKKYEGKEEWELAVINISYGNEELRTILDNGVASGNIIELHKSNE